MGIASFSLFVRALCFCARLFRQKEQHLSDRSFNISDVVRFHASQATHLQLSAMGVLRDGHSRVVSMAKKDHTMP